MKCGQQTCQAEAEFKVYWPGKKMVACGPCAGKAQGLGQFMGFHVTVEELTAADVVGMAAESPPGGSP